MGYFGHTVLVMVLGLLLISNQSITHNSAVSIDPEFAFQYGSTYSIQLIDLFSMEMINGTILNSTDTFTSSFTDPITVVVLDVNSTGDTSFFGPPVANISYAMEHENQSYNPSEGFILGQSPTDEWFDLFIIGLLISAFTVAFFDPSTVDFSLPPNSTSDGDNGDAIFPIFASSNQTIYDGLWQDYLENDLDPEVTGSPTLGFSFYNQSQFFETNYNGTDIADSYIYNDLDNVTKTFEMSLFFNSTRWGDFNGSAFYVNTILDYHTIVNYGLGNVEDVYMHLRTEEAVGTGEAITELKVGFKSQYLGISDISKYTDPNYTPTSTTSSTYSPTSTYTTTTTTTTSTNTTTTNPTSSYSSTSTPIDNPTSTSSSTSPVSTSNAPTSSSIPTSTSNDDTSDGNPSLPLGGDPTNTDSTTESDGSPTVDFYFIPVISGFIMLNLIRRKINKNI